MSGRRARTLGWLALLVAAAAPVQTVCALEEPTLGYAEVQGAFLREDFSEVIARSEAFILGNPAAPEVPRVWMWLALSLDRSERSHEALREIERLKRRLSTKGVMMAELLYWEGDISRRTYEMGRARTAYERLLEQYPGSRWTSQAQLGLGMIDLHQQAFEPAIDWFRLVAAREEGTPAAVDARLFEGVCHLHLKRFAKAAALFTPLLDQLEADAVAQVAFYLGESLNGLERYGEAAEAYRRAIDSADTIQWSQPAQFGLGWAYYRAGRCEESVREFEVYVAQRAEYETEATFAQGSCLMKLGEVKQALQRFEQIVSRDPDHALALESGFILVDAYRREERYALAKALLHAFLRRELSGAAESQVQIRLGLLALDEGNAQQAKTIFALAAGHDEPSVRQAALNGLGDVYLSVSDLPKAKTYYEEAATVSAQTALTDYAAYQVGRIHLQLGEFDLAIGTFKRIAAERDSSLADDARLALVIAYLNREEIDLTRALLDEIREKDAGSELAARAGYYEALIALRDGEEITARERCETLVERAPFSDEAFEARLLLAELRSRERSTREVMDELLHVYKTERLPRAQRARLAKQLGDFARQEEVYPEAIKWYERAGNLLPSLASEASYRIASCYEESGDLELAMTWYKKVATSPWRVRGQLAVAKLLERQDRPASARRIYEQLAEEPIPEAKLIKERLAALRSESRNGE